MMTNHNRYPAAAGRWIVPAAICCAVCCVLACLPNRASGQDTQRQADANDAVSRDRQVRRDIAALQKQIAAAGGWRQASDRLKRWRAGVARRLDNRPTPARGKSFIARDAPLAGTAGRLISARRTEQLLHDANVPSTDRLGLQRYEQFRKTTLALHRLLASRGIDLIVVPVPDKGDIYPGDLAELPDANATVQLQSKRTYLQLMRAGVEVVDMEPALRKAAAAEKKNDPVYMLRDTHWAPRGMRIAAKELARRLKRYEAVAHAGLQKDRFELKPATLDRVGDLAKNWTAAGKKAFPPERYRLPGVCRAGSGKAAWTDRDSPVLVLGDSYAVFPYDGRLSFWAWLSRETNLPVAAENKAGGASWQAKNISRTGALKKRRRVVIWLLTNCSLYEQEFKPPREASGVAADRKGFTAEIVLAASPPKVDPETLDYPDALVTLPARVSRVVQGRYDSDEVLVVFPLIEARKITSAGSLKKGSRLRAKLQPDVPDDRATWMMLDDTDRFDLPALYATDFGPVKDKP